VLDIGRSAISMTVGEHTVLTAFLQHPRGDAAVLEGVLLGPGEPAEYGAFVRGEGGRWSIDVGWDDLAQRMDLSFELELSIDFTARFVDDAGAVGERGVALALHCSTIAPTACDGACADLAGSNLHCGGCDRPCVEQITEPFGEVVGGCSLGACLPHWSACADMLGFVDCTDVCHGRVGSCVEAGCAGRTTAPQDDRSACGEQVVLGDGIPEPDSCDAPLAGVVSRCCCTQ
jgi:hypothetical protein